MRIALWLLFALSAVATVHLGWHYVVDDVAGVLIGLVALALAKVLGLRAAHGRGDRGAAAGLR